MQGIVGHSASEPAWFFLKLLALNSPQAVVCVSTFTFLACISCYTLNFYCYLQWDHQQGAATLYRHKTNTIIVHDHEQETSEVRTPAGQQAYSHSPQMSFGHSCAYIAFLGDKARQLILHGLQNIAYCYHDISLMVCECYFWIKVHSSSPVKSSPVVHFTN